MSRRRCVGCGQWYVPDARVKNQRFCPKPECRLQRRREYQKRKIGEDAAYRANQADCQKRWREKNPGYWRQYRDSHPEYTQKNREKQKGRNGGSGGPVAKMDSINHEKPIIAGIYELNVLSGDILAKMDSIKVKLEFISDSY